MPFEPRDIYDMTGWHELTCEQADLIHARHRGLDRWHVESSLTDIDGEYGPPIIFTEWWYGDQPVLRDYRGRSDRPCEHYGAMDDSAAAWGQ